MRRVAFGATGCEVTRIGLGLAGLGRPGYLTLGHGEDLPADRSVAGLEAHTHAVLDHAVARGVGYLDVARSYGLAEVFLGRWLSARGTSGRGSAVTVGSKWGYTYTADWRIDADVHEVKEHTLVTLERQLAETRAALGEHLAIYQIHSATLDSGVLDDAEVLAALHALADSGVVIGLSLSGPRQAATLERALQLTAQGQAPFASVQATWNLLEPSVGPALLAAREAGWGVIIKEAVANGRLAGRGAVPAVLASCAARHGVGVDAVALAAALAQPFATVVLSGAVTTAQLDANLAALDVALDDEELAELAVIAEDPHDYWRRRAGMPWT